MEQVIYDCARCFYRPEVAQALADIQQELAPRGLGLKMYDCYRPRPYQQRLWDVMPDARYVARPERGSVHSRGAAADLTLINLDTGVELDMGTPYDFFGERAYTTTTDLPADVLQNRAILQDVMQRHGFATIRTEWWHFNFTGPRYELSDWVWPCE
jgi:D-alanyl-D-alanine dipeptidase